MLIIKTHLDKLKLLIKDNVHLKYKEDLCGQENIAYEFVAKYYIAMYKYLCFNDVCLAHFKNKNVENEMLCLKNLLNIKMSEPSKKLFICWLLEKGNDKINYILNNIDNNKTEELSIVLEYYHFSLWNALDNKDMDVLEDCLYSIPSKLFQDCEKYKLFERDEVK